LGQKLILDYYNAGFFTGLFSFFAITSFWAVFSLGLGFGLAEVKKDKKCEKVLLINRRVRNQSYKQETE
jgi:hypothetical protein